MSSSSRTTPSTTPGWPPRRSPEADTILEDDVEDVGEVELDDEDEAPVPVAAPVAAASRTGRIQVEEEESEGMGLRVAMILNAALLVITVPVALDLASPEMSDITKSIVDTVGGIFGFTK